MIVMMESALSGKTLKKASDGVGVQLQADEFEILE